MTKHRPPMSIDAAMARIAGQLQGGWAEMGQLVGKAERTVRNWGDPGTPEQIPVDAAVAFDVAFQAAGGIGAPILEAYTGLVQVAMTERFAEQYELAALNAEFIREAGQAGAAVVQASAPDADLQDKREALRECEEAVTASNRIVAALRRALKMKPAGPEVPP